MIVSIILGACVAIGLYSMIFNNDFNPNHPEEIILLVWERTDVYVRSGKDTKHPPEFVDRGEDEYGNPQLYFKLPVGLGIDKIAKSVDTISTFFKTEVLIKLTDNHPKAHFLLTIPKGKVYDLVNVTNIDEFLKEVNTLDA